MAFPTSFRLFRTGENTSTKGAVLFDAKAARDVMAAYAKHGADMMLDLEHLSVKRDSPNYNPNAMGWFKLALRGGELWAVDVRYTPEGLERLAAKKQRYISPLFWVDKISRRVSCVMNAALTALPATDQPMALVGASQIPFGLMAFSTIGPNMDLSALIELLGLPPEATLDDIVAAVKALQEGGTAAPAAPVAASEPGEGGATAAPATGNGVGMQPGPKKTTVSIQHSAADVGAAAVLALSQEVAQLKAKDLAKDRDALIAANVSKLTPVLEAWARTQPLATLKTFFAAAGPAENADEEATREATAAAAGGTAVIALSQAELDLCADTGVNPADVLAYKTQEAKGKK